MSENPGLVGAMHVLGKPKELWDIADIESFCMWFHTAVYGDPGSVDCSGLGRGFPSAAALASWAKVCPGNNQSGGKRRSGSTGKVKTPLRTTLVEAAHGASRKRNTYLGTMFWRLAARKGKQRAAMAVAHRILIIAYHILKDGTTYQDLGPDCQTQHNREAVIRRALTQLKAVGCTAKIEDAD